MRVHLLGAFAVAVDDRPAPEAAWRLRKAKTLVKLLALAPGHRLHREQVIAVLWPERSPDAAANNLHQVLHVARRQLGGGDAGRRRLPLDDDVLSLSGDGPLWIDAEAFRREAVEALRSGEPERASAALELYGGPLLPEDLYEDWTEPVRGELASLQEELAVLADASGGAGGAVSRHDNLPIELTTFVGREAELDELARLLRRGPLVTVVGAAGCGKTRLGLEAAARQRARFREGVWLVELAPVMQPDLIADAVAAAVGLKPARARAITALVEALAAHEALIVLDNCDHVVAACAHLAEALLRGCPGVQVLATSREPLQVTGEIVSRLAPLRLPAANAGASPGELLRSEAVRLFVDRAAAAQPGFTLTEHNAADVARVCHNLDGVPLAIELAAARVGSLPPAEIAARLGESFRLLAQERRTAEPRQQTLAGALDWSYRLLDADEAALLRRLAVFTGSFDLAAVEAVAGVDDAVDVLLRLVRKSLVVAEEAEGKARYRQLEMIRQYAGERLAEAHEREALAERHARWYLELPGRAGAAGSELRLRQLDLEPDNLRGALTWLLDHDPAAALRLADSLGDWWLMRGRLVEGREWLEVAVERGPEATPAAAAALLRAMGFAGRAGAMSEGRRLAERSLSISRGLGDREGVSQALHAQGVWAWLRGPYSLAGELLGEAIEEARQAGSPMAEANATHALGLLAASQRDLPRAAAVLAATLELLERPPEDSPPAFVVATMGLVPLAVPRRLLRRVVQEDSQITFRRVGPGPAAAYVRTSLAVVARLEGDPAHADVLLGDALARLRAVDDAAGVALVLAGIGRLATLEGDPERAHGALLESLALRRRLGDIRSVGLTLALLAEVAADGGDLEHARSLLERVIGMFGDVGDRPGALWVLGALAHVELTAGRPDVCALGARRPRTCRADRGQAGRGSRPSRGRAGALRGARHARHARVDARVARGDRSAGRRHGAGAAPARRRARRFRVLRRRVGTGTLRRARPGAGRALSAC